MIEPEMSEATLDGLRLMVKLPLVEGGSTVPSSLDISIPLWDATQRDNTMKVVQDLVAGLKNGGWDVSMKTSHKVIGMVDL